MLPGDAPIAATEVVRRPAAWPRLLGWVGASIPATGIATAVVLLLWIWVALSRAFGDTDVSRGRILVGMIVWSLPQALVAGAIESWPAFAAAWLVVALGLWSPRAIIRGLRPGVFG